MAKPTGHARMTQCALIFGCVLLGLLGLYGMYFTSTILAAAKELRQGWTEDSIMDVFVPSFTFSILIGISVTVFSQVRCYEHELERIPLLGGLITFLGYVVWAWNYDNSNYAMLWLRVFSMFYTGLFTELAVGWAWKLVAGCVWLADYVEDNWC